jgi:hypothetical protein
MKTMRKQKSCSSGISHVLDSTLLISSCCHEVKFQTPLLPMSSFIQPHIWNSYVTFASHYSPKCNHSMSCITSFMNFVLPTPSLQSLCCHCLSDIHSLLYFHLNCHPRSLCLLDLPAVPSTGIFIPHVCSRKAMPSFRGGWSKAI